MSAGHNLDRLAARIAQGIVGDRKGDEATKLENMATKALGVVQENGVYAGLLFLYSRPKDEEAKIIRDKLLCLLAADEIKALNVAFSGQNAWGAVSKHLITKVTDDLDTLLLVKELYEQTLIYVRYGAKAAGG